MPTHLQIKTILTLFILITLFSCVDRKIDRVKKRLSGTWNPIEYRFRAPGWGTYFYEPTGSIVIGSFEGNTASYTQEVTYLDGEIEKNENQVGELVVLNENEIKLYLDDDSGSIDTFDCLFYLTNNDFSIEYFHGNVEDNGSVKIISEK